MEITRKEQESIQKDSFVKTKLASTVLKVELPKIKTPQKGYKKRFDPAEKFYFRAKNNKSKFRAV